MTTKRDKILGLFLRKNWVPNYKLNRIAFRYGAIIFDLRKEGYEFSLNYKGKGLVFYKLTKDPYEKNIRNSSLSNR